MGEVWRRGGGDSGQSTFLAADAVIAPVVGWRRKAKGALECASAEGVFVREEGEAFVDGMRTTTALIRCLDPERGKVRYSIPSPPRVDAIDVIDDVLFIAHYGDAALAGYDARSGASCFSKTFEGRHVAFLDRTTHLVRRESELVALGVSSNERAFSIDLASRAAFSESAKVSALGILLHGRGSGVVELFDRANGTSRWRVDLAPHEVITACSDANGAILSTSEGRNHAWTMIDERGAKLWTNVAPFGSHVAALTSDFVIAVEERRVVALDRDTGALRAVLQTYAQDRPRTCAAVRDGVYLSFEPAGLAFVRYDGTVAWKVEDKDLRPHKYFRVFALSGRAFVENPWSIFSVAG